MLTGLVMFAVGVVVTTVVFRYAPSLQVALTADVAKLQAAIQKKL